MNNKRTKPNYWLIADTHFFHDKLLSIIYRHPNYYNKIINNWKNTVLPIDIVIHLGDVIFYKYNELKNILDSLPGKKILTIGNHDHKTISWYNNNGFDFCCESFTMNNIIFSHKKIDNLEKGFINIHGHQHILINDNHTINRLVSPELEDFKLLELQKFIKNSSCKNYYKNRLKKYNESIPIDYTRKYEISLE